MNAPEPIFSNKRDYLDVLLIADPDDEMIGRYLDAGDLYVWREDGQVAAVAVMLQIDGNTVELKNIGVLPEYRRRRLASRMIAFLKNRYAAEGFRRMTVGTGGTGIPGTEFFQLELYRQCGFRDDYVVRNFFTDNYPEPIFEDNGLQCVDMVYLTCDLTAPEK